MPRDVQFCPPETVTELIQWAWSSSLSLPSSSFVSWARCTLSDLGQTQPSAWLKNNEFKNPWTLDESRPEPPSIVHLKGLTLFFKYLYELLNMAAQQWNDQRATIPSRTMKAPWETLCLQPEPWWHNYPQFFAFSPRSLATLLFNGREWITSQPSYEVELGVVNGCKPALLYVVMYAQMPEKENERRRKEVLFVHWRSFW